MYVIKSIERYITTVAIYGAIILPNLAHTLPTPIPLFLTTVGNISLLYKYMVGKLIAVPAMPILARKSCAVGWFIITVKSKLKAVKKLPPINIFKRETLDINERTIMVPGNSSAAVK